MTSASTRDPVANHLITPQNVELVLIDYQPAQLSGVRSMDPGLLLKNSVSTVKTAKTFGLPIVHSTVNVAIRPGKADRCLRRRLGTGCEQLALMPPAVASFARPWVDETKFKVRLPVYKSLGAGPPLHFLNPDVRDKRCLR